MGLKTCRLVAILTLLAPLLLAVTQGEAQQKVRMNVFIVDAGVVVARAKGLFPAEGLDVNVTITRSSTEQIRGLGSGAFEIAQTAFDNVLYWSGREGAEIVTVAQQSDWIRLPVIVRQEIKDWNDLRGKKLAVDAADTAFALTLRRILLARGLDLKRGD